MPPRPPLRHVNLQDVPGPTGSQSEHCAGTRGRRQDPNTMDRMTEKGKAYRAQCEQEHARRQRKQQQKDTHYPRKPSKIPKPRPPRQIPESDDDEDSFSAQERAELEADPHADEDAFSDTENQIDKGLMPAHKRVPVAQEFIVHNSTTQTNRSTLPKPRLNPTHAVSSPAPIRPAKPHANVTRLTQSSPSPDLDFLPEDSLAPVCTEPHNLQLTDQPNPNLRKAKRAHADMASELEPDADESDNPPSDDNAEPDHKKQRSRSGRARPRAADYDGQERSVLEMAQAEFQVRVCTEYAYPEERNDDAATWATECWDNACDHKEVTCTLNSAQRRLILERVSTIRGRVKDKVIGRVPSHYGFKPGNKDTTIESNKRLAAKLLDASGYIFDDLDGLKGMYEHPILQDVINAQWFSKKKKSDGIVYGASFNPMPDATIALVFTAVEHAVRQWASGQLVNSTPFTEVEYHDVYKRHLDSINRWRHFNSRTAKAMARHKQRLYDYGRSAAGFNHRDLAKEPQFDDARLAQIAAAMHDNSDSD